jgi:hypothetical protein
MLSNFSQYAPQGLAPQIPGIQSFGAAQLGNPWLGHELVQQGPGQAQIVPVLGQLAQQLAIQCALTQQIAQQINSAVQHLAHQLAFQGLPGQYYGHNPLAASIQGGYSGFNPQAQAWGVPRPPTVQ